jgi:hypothetical protein
VLPFFGNAMFRYPSRSSWPGRSRPLAIDGAHGVHYPSQYCSCPPSFGSSSDPHDPLAVFRTSPRMIFVGGSAVLYTVQIYASPTFVSDSRSRPFAAASGFSKCLARAIRSGRFTWTEPAVTAVGFVLFQVCRYAISGAAHAILEVSRGPSAAGNRFRLLSARELGLVACLRCV